jgi:hypothetical protein
MEEEAVHEIIVIYPELKDHAYRGREATSAI